MISIRIPKDIREYKEKIMLGLTIRQLICLIIALSITIPLYILGSGKIPEEILSWLIILIAAPIVAIGFVRIHNMPFEKFLKYFLFRLILVPNKRYFISENAFREWNNEAKQEEEKQYLKKNKKQKENTSLIIAAYMEKSERSGSKIEMEKIKEKIMSTERKEKKKKTGSKKSNENIDRSFEKLKEKAEAIKAKRENHSHYIYTNSERKILTKFEKKNWKKQNESIKKEHNYVEKKNKKMIKRRYAPTIIPKSTQQTIPFIADYDEGLFETEPGKFNKVYKIYDLNYTIASEEEQVNIFTNYRDFLNYFSDEYNISVSIDNHIVSKQEQEQNVLYKKTGDEYDKHREEYNSILRRQIVAGMNDMVQNKYISVAISAETPVEALYRFHKIDEEILDNLKKIGTKGYVLSTTERLSLLHDKFRKGHEGEFKIDYDFIKLQGISSKDYIAPSFVQFSNKHFIIDDEYYKCFYLNNLPSNLTDKFLRNVMETNFPLTVTLNIQPLDKGKAMKMVNKQHTGMEANKIEAQKRASKSGYDPESGLNHNLKQSIAEAVQLLEDLTIHDQKMFLVTASFMVNGSSIEELNERYDIVAGKISQTTCQVQNFIGMQEPGFQITIPGGQIPDKKVFVDRALTSESSAIFMPFSAVELFQPGGYYYGLNQITRNLILCNRTLMKTPSGFILGKSGSGKSFATKREILNVLLNDSKTSILIIDPENEYASFAREFGGEVINISMDSDCYINPMEMTEDYGLDENDKSDEIDIEKKKVKALQKKSDFIMSIIECMLSVNGKTVINPQQKTMIDKCVKNCYQKYLDNDFDSYYLPTLEDLQCQFDKEKNGSESARLIAEGAEYYTRGSMNIFSHKSNVDFNNRMVVFNIRDLGNQLKQIALSIVLDFIWNKMISNSEKDIRTYCYVDEIHVLFQNEHSSAFLKQLYKRGRKYGLVITGITQNMEDLLSSSEARGMIGNSEFIMMLSQASSDLEILAPMLNISESQVEYVKQAEIGQGLLFAENIIVPFVDRFPTDSYLYSMMSTKFKEKTETEKKKKVKE